MALDRVLHGGQKPRTVAEVEAERWKQCQAIEPGSEGCPHRGSCRFNGRCMAMWRVGRG